ncbi:MAG: 2OG-Fe(II) oxygenase [Sulfurovaceae bacterium]|nr:2OG-Fe(II) oxygenase [Sulfurovaceae bacterium]
MNEKTKKLYLNITDALVEDGYIVIDNALTSHLTKQLLEVAKTQNSYNQAGISASSDLHIDSTKRTDKTSWLDEDKGVQSEYLAQMDGLKNYLNRELYLGLSYFETHFAIYEVGDFYEKHLDAFKNSKNRVVTVVYYLNNDWNEKDGGELIVYDKDDKFLAKVTPQANKMIVFMSEKFPHEVLPAKTTRYSIAGWFRVDK